MRLRYATPVALGLLSLALFSRPESDGQVLSQNQNLTIFFTGDTDGQIVSCGCPELDYGGESRKASFFNKLRDADWKFLTLEVGGIAPFAPLDSQLRLKTRTLASAMGTMVYDAVSLNDRDLALGKAFVEDLLSRVGHPVLATNYSTGLEEIPQQIVTVRDRRVGIVSFLDPELVTKDHAWLTVEPWENQGDRIKDLRDQVDVLVATAAVGSRARMRDLARMYPDLDLILGSHRGELMPDVSFEGHTALMGAPPKGRYLGRVEVSFNPKGEIQKIEGIALPVQDYWGSTAPVDSIVAAYYADLRALISSDSFLEERRQNLKEPPFEYVGNEQCASCHEAQFTQWQGTDHAHARETLAVEDKDQVPECQSCHSTGYGFRTGFVTPDTTPEYWEVGCESCHGPGAEHVKDTKVPYGIIMEEACTDCHTSHDSPDFDYETYLPQVTH